MSSFKIVRLNHGFNFSDFSEMGKPRGIRCARKMRNRRRDQRWADLGYKKANLGTALKVS